MSNEKPIWKRQTGGVQVAVWRNLRTQNEGPDRVSFSLTMERRFKNQEGRWKSTSSIRENDIPKAVLLLNQAFEFICMGQAREVDDGSGYGEQP